MAKVKPTSNPKLKLHGFNNLTKSLSFNIYDICYARSKAENREYIEYIDEVYNAKRLTAILTEEGVRRRPLGQEPYLPAST